MNRAPVIRAAIAAIAVIGASAWPAYPHCQMPCGIYDDDARLAEIHEDIATVEKAMRQVVELGAAEKPNYNQLVRWVNTKEHHADHISEVVTQYFMTQRIQPVDPADQKAYADYAKKLTVLHRMLVAAMKAKQTTDLQYTRELDMLLHEFTQAYGSKTQKT